MESKSRRTPRLAAPVDDRPPAATRAAPQPAVAPPKPPVAPPPALPEAESAVVPTAAPSEESTMAGPVVDSSVETVPEAAPALPPMLTPAQPAPDRAAETADDMLAAIAQSRTALARGLESIGNEVASYARHSLDASAQAAIQLLEAKTWADAFAVNSGFARTSFDYWLGSTAKVSELGIKLAIDWSKPLASGFGKVWSGTQPAR
jgi:hypothetical protein